MPALVFSLSTLLPPAIGQTTDTVAGENAWVDLRLPFSELKEFLDVSDTTSEEAAANIPPVAAATLDARLSLDWQDSGPEMVMKLETENFTGHWQALPILAADAMLRNAEPAGARLLVHQNHLCVLLAKNAKESLLLRQSLPADGATYRFIPPTAGTLSLEVTRLPDDSVIGIQVAGEEVLVDRAGPVVLPSASGPWILKKHARADIAKLTAPPEPSNWSWQHEVVVVPDDGELACTLFSRVSAGQGSGLEAVATLPPEARSPVVEGEDLDGVPVIARQDDGSQRIQLRWKSRDRLDRQLVIRYRLPFGPLDTAWTIPVPRPPEGQNSRSRFIIATDPGWSYDAQGLSAPTVSTALSAKLAGALGNRPCRIIEGADSVKIALTPRAVVETSPTVIHEAIWQSRLEPDGSGLHEGTLVVEHRGAATCLLELPAGSRLLSCSMDGQAIKPHRSGESGLEFPLPPGTETRRTKLALAYTSRTDAFHPVEGTLPLALPRGSDFIRGIQWSVTLPAGYQAETHGNTKRLEPAKADARNVLRLEKNLCRDERPEATIFYQRADLPK